LTKAKRSVERAIADLNFTSIQASWFMEVWLSPALGFDYVHGKVRLYGSGSKPISWVSYRDAAFSSSAQECRSGPYLNHKILRSGQSMSQAAVQ
jgi:hypothetical protein